jgi:dihydroorotase-like cyclic amidohydrolase
VGRLSDGDAGRSRGGVTTLVDMPLNCVPETIDVPALEAKRAAAQGKAWVDWAAWGGVVRGNADALEPLARAGVPGFKCFLIHSGIDGFAWVDEADLRLLAWQSCAEPACRCWPMPRCRPGRRGDEKR